MWKKRFLWLLKLTVGLALILILYKQIDQREEIWQAYRKANWVNVAIALFLLIPNFFLQFLKWRYLLKNRYPRMKNPIVLKSLLFGATLGFVTPGSLGDLARSLFFARYNRYVITGLNVIDKVFNMLIFTTVGLLCLNVYMFRYFRWADYVLIPLAVLSLLVVVLFWIVAFNPQWVRSLLYGLNTMLPAREKIKSFISCLNHFQRRHSLVMALLAFGWFFVILLQYHALLLAFTHISLIHSFLGVGALMLTKMVLPISFGDLGIREGASVFYFSYFHLPAAAAFNAALLIFVINFVLPALVGSYFVFQLRWELRERSVSNPPADS